MPKPSARSRRITAALLGIGLSLTACSGGGGGGGGGGGATTTGSTSTTTATSSVTLAWTSASGPVAGYSVYVQRNGGAYKHEADVPQNRATVYGEPGSTARLVVLGFDASHAHGPMSPNSVQFTFPAANASSQGASAAAAGFVGTQAASAPAAAALMSNSIADPVSDPTSSERSSGDTAEEPPAPDLPGGALVWQAGDGFRLTNAAVETARLFARPEAGAQLVGVADFDADGQGDLLWLTAAAELAYMPGRVLRGSDPVSLVPLESLPATAKVIGAGDFDGDGYGDVLIDRNGVVRARLTRPAGAVQVAELGSSAGAALAGIADFDANGSDDVAWRTSTGALVFWMMNGGTASATVDLEIANDVDVVGIGDFDGDGAAEVATRDPAGSVFVVHPLASLPSFEATDLANVQGWTGVGAVDFELDHSDELVLVTAEAIRLAGLPGEQVVALDPESPWQLVALLP